MHTAIHDLTAPICVSQGKVTIPRPPALEFTIEQVGHDLILGKGPPIKYLSNVIRMNVHMATHYDLPYTFGYQHLPVSELEPDRFVRRAIIVETTTSSNKTRPISRRDLKLPPRFEEEFQVPDEQKPALIIKTGMYRYWCVDNERYMRFPGLSRELVEWIANQLKPPILAIDAISVDRTMEYRTTNLYPYVDEDFLRQVRAQENLALLNHDVLMKKGVLILENIYPRSLPQGLKTGLLIAPPIFRLECTPACKISALPARPLLVEPPPSMEELLNALRDLRRLIG